MLVVYGFRFGFLSNEVRYVLLTTALLFSFKARTLALRGYANRFCRCDAGFLRILASAVRSSTVY